MGQNTENNNKKVNFLLIMPVPGHQPPVTKDFTPFICILSLLSKIIKDLINYYIYFIEITILLLVLLLVLLKEL